jgi:hypothetical protein
MRHLLLRVLLFFEQTHDHAWMQIVRISPLYCHKIALKYGRAKIVDDATLHQEEKLISLIR